MSNPNLQSGFIRFLDRRFFDPSTLGSRSFLTKAHITMKRRDYFRRLMAAAANGQIPHPIFSNKFLNLVGFEKIWRAKLIESALSKMDSSSLLLVEAKKIKTLVQKFNDFFDRFLENNEPFAIKFESKDQDSTIIMKFIPEKNCGNASMMVVLHMINQKIGLNLTITLYDLEISQIPYYGVVLKKVGTIYQPVQFFYTKQVWTPFDEFNINPNGFFVDYVHFFTINPNPNPPKILHMPINSNTAYTCKASLDYITTSTSHKRRRIK